MSDRKLWVAFMPDGFPMGCMNRNPKSGDDPAKAAREFWDTSANALKHVTTGYRIELVAWERWSKELLPIHLGKGAATGGA